MNGHKITVSRSKHTTTTLCTGRSKDYDRLTNDRRVELDFAPLGGQGDGGVLNAALLLQRGLDQVNARRARHAVDLKRFENLKIG